MGHGVSLVGRGGRTGDSYCLATVADDGVLADQTWRAPGATAPLTGLPLTAEWDGGAAPKRGCGAEGSGAVARTWCMTSIAAAAAFICMFLLPAATASAAEVASQSFYCVTTTPLQFQGQQVWPGSEYCVPGP